MEDQTQLEPVETDAEPEEAPPVRQLNPWIVALLGLLVIGWGQIYTGRFRAAPRWLELSLALLFAVGVFVIPASYWAGFLSAIVLLGIRVVAIVEAVKFARAHPIIELDRYSTVFGVILFGVAATVAVTVVMIPVRHFGFSAYRIPTSSMENTLLVGDYLITDTRQGWTPHTGDVVVFAYPLDPRIQYVKRCAAGPGQTVELRDKQLYVDGRRIDDPPGVKFYSRTPLGKGVRERGIFAPAPPVDRSATLSGEANPAPEPPAWNHDNYGPLKVPAWSYFVLGDNRDNSADSRYYGFVPAENISGRVAYLYLSLERNPLRIRWSRIGLTIR
jgi:signal peptidase I